MASLLLIDDDRSLTELLSGYLVEEGYKVQVAHNGNEGLRALYATHPDLVVLDVTMPERDGWQTLERIRELSSMPVIMLTARGEETNVLRGFSLGADDYVTKPFSFAELAARVRSVLNRTQQTAFSGQPEEAPQLLHQGDLVVDLIAKRVWRNQTLIHLTPTEFKLLTVLMEHANEPVTPHDLVRRVWGEQYASDLGYVRRYVWHLRKKIERDPAHPQYIHNEHGFGYRFYVVEKAE